MAPVKAPFFVAKELAFEQAGRDRGAIDLDKRAMAEAAHLMYGVRDQFFTGSGLAEDQHGRVAHCHSRDLVQHLLVPHAKAL